MRRSTLRKEIAESGSPLSRGILELFEEADIVLEDQTQVADLEVAERQTLKAMPNAQPE